MCSDLFPVVEVDTGIRWLGTSYTLEVDCTAVKLELKRGKGEGWMGSLKLDALKGEMTYFIGRHAGDKLPGDAGVLEARVGVFVTMHDEKGLMAAGVEGEGSAVGPDGAGWEGEFQADFVALLGGPPADGEQERKWFTKDLSPKFAVGE
jgi:hypothetical protein